MAAAARWSERDPSGDAALEILGEFETVSRRVVLLSHKEIGGLESKLDELISILKEIEGDMQDVAVRNALRKMRREFIGAAGALFEFQLGIGKSGTPNQRAQAAKQRKGLWIDYQKALEELNEYLERVTR
ncbi:hypothetical protein [Pseudofrankia sp. BMG5.36]|uniref:hypothetical protein n=1 Tax=Pseudofrankia sp. BMG5.36 TaxID=1834512 RepID=UPI001041C389|nr:hypothetical protein [Pseudofrankia sp. BMG5.36]